MSSRTFAGWADLARQRQLAQLVLCVLSAAERLCPSLNQFVHISSLAALRMSEIPGSLSYSLSKLAAHHAVADHRTRARLNGRPTRVSTVTVTETVEVRDITLAPMGQAR